MSAIRFIARSSCLISLIALLAGCVIVPRGGYHEGYYDRPHHRYWHDNGWHDCHDRDDHCH
ncbi:MAG TPA: hypothetical protein VGR92_03805 [Steroidobacteraceae bacterium]|nr:hypothetical protein [Steroidobacteraceae bacterium]